MVWMQSWFGGKKPPTDSENWHTAMIFKDFCKKLMQMPPNRCGHGGSMLIGYCYNPCNELHGTANLQRKPHYLY
jgi:hypothetical protein